MSFLSSTEDSCLLELGSCDLNGQLPGLQHASSLFTEDTPQELPAGVLRDGVDELDAREPLEVRLVVGDVLRDQFLSTLSHVWHHSMAHKPS